MTTKKMTLAEATEKAEALEKANAELNKQLAKAEKKKAADVKIEIKGKEYLVKAGSFHLNGLNYKFSELEADKKQLEKVASELLEVKGQNILVEAE